MVIVVSTPHFALGALISCCIEHLFLSEVSAPRDTIISVSIAHFCAYLSSSHRMGILRLPEGGRTASYRRRGEACASWKGVASSSRYVGKAELCCQPWGQSSCCTAYDWLISHPVFGARLIKPPGEKE